ncbi:MAG TPA: GNAT family N-acetyltransferase [Gaiellaceae bacterium]|nr:GNAT family N-acetyltransferase [Gaiellaceae bacterium]
MEIRPLGQADRARADTALPLHRLEQANSEYLVAWDADEPVGHVCVEWCDPPELQDLWVLPARRGTGIGAALVAEVESAVAARGCTRLLLSVGIGNEGAIRLYGRLGYRRTRNPPRRVKGTIVLRGGPFEVDDTLLEFEKAVESGASPSSST